MTIKITLKKMITSRLALPSTSVDKIFSDEDLENYLDRSLMMLQSMIDPLPTWQTVENDLKYHDLLVQGAVITALSSLALIEKGRESTVDSGGIAYTPADLSNFLLKSAKMEFEQYMSKIPALKVDLY